MLIVDRPQDMKAHVGEEIGSSNWVTVDQAMINKFADATDHNVLLTVLHDDGTTDTVVFAPTARARANPKE